MQSRPLRPTGSQSAGDNNRLAVVGNLGKARRSWGSLSWVLVREGADPGVLWMFYTAVAQAVLLFGAETWVLTPRMEKALDSFHSRVARRITGRQPRQRKDGSWVYPPMVRARKESVMMGIRTSIKRRQNTVAEYIATRPILDLCEQATWQPGARVSWRWWEHSRIDLEGGAKMGSGIIDDKRGNIFRGGFGRGAKQDRRRGQGGVSGSERVQWRGLERDGGRLSTHLDLQKDRNHDGKQISNIKLKRDRA